MHVSSAAENAEHRGADLVVLQRFACGGDILFAGGMRREGRGLTMDLGLNGKVAIVGGGSMGIGYGIARTLAVKPEVVLMDEPCSSLDPIATARIEDLMQEIKTDYTIIIVTHNMQQAARVSDKTGFFNIAGARKPGELVEYDTTEKMFSAPENEATEAYISGRFG